MDTLSMLLHLLAESRTELRRFIAEPDTWIASNACNLSKGEVDDLKLIAGDIERFIEVRCHQALNAASEMRFAKATGIGRRHLMLTGASVLLALPIAARMNRQPPQLPAVRAAGQPLGIDAGCHNSGSSCVDNPCENTGCTDSGACSDIDCQNNLGCSDNGSNQNCVDTDCVNQSCEDDRCTDGGCDNQLSCSDTRCTDNNTCSNDASCEDSTCTDGPCSNALDCANNASCT